VVDLLPKLVWHMDEPIADPAAISCYLICAAAREQLTVVLSGMGSDEMLAGYPRYLATGLTRPLDLLPAGLRKSLRSAISGRLTMGQPGGRGRALRRNALEVLRGFDQNGIRRALYFSAYYRPEELRSLLLPGPDEVCWQDPFGPHQAYADRVSRENWLNQSLYVDMKTFLPSLNLAYTDKMSMAASTEVRVPLLDDELVALYARIPPGLKLHRTTQKYILKRAMEGVLPDEIIWRPKAGFGAPIRSWLVGGLKPMVDDLLSPATIKRRGLFEPDAVARLIRENEQGVGDHALRIWTLLVLEIWQQTFIDGGA
jgi:asparagine synthase (glutamine-hydrolysing)